MTTRETLAFVGVASLAAWAQADGIIFDFDNVPAHTPLPIGVTMGGITASRSGTG